MDALNRQGLESIYLSPIVLVAIYVYDYCVLIFF